MTRLSIDIEIHVHLVDNAIRRSGDAAEISGLSEAEQAALRQLARLRVVEVAGNPLDPGRELPPALRTVGQLPVRRFGKPRRAVLAADCAPVLFTDPEAGVIGAAHGGWRGTLAGVMEATVAAMAKLGARPERVRAGNKAIELARVRITEAGRRALAATEQHR